MDADQQQHFSHLGWQLVHCARDLCQELAQLERAFRVTMIRRPRVEDVFRLETAGFVRRAVQIVANQIHRNAVEPSRKFRLSAELIQGSGCFEERLLSNVFSLVEMPDPTNYHPMQSNPVLGKKALELPLALGAGGVGRLRVWQWLRAGLIGGSHPIKRTAALPSGSTKSEISTC
ncbi:hypothetical protein VARIO8X_90183 [Burkholderiales bacterium 8X]|nr:hypothetical protein VARIO8X_90183 [Burkholderiales bacterium 8X]